MRGFYSDMRRMIGVCSDMRSTVIYSDMRRMRGFYSDIQ